MSAASWLCGILMAILIGAGFMETATNEDSPLANVFFVLALVCFVLGIFLA